MTQFSYAKRHNDAGGLSLMTFWNSEKLSNFKVDELPWVVNELCTRIVRVRSSCPLIYRAELSEKNRLSAVKTQATQATKNNTRQKTTGIRHIKL